MAFEKKTPDWKATGIEPPESLKESGFLPGQKPPSDYFNWFWRVVSEALHELQSKLSNVDNTSDMDKPVSTAQAAAIAEAAKSGSTEELTGHIDDKNNPHGVTKAQVGLGAVDNTSDMDKPVSTAQAAAIAEVANAMGDFPIQLDIHTSDTTAHLTAAERRKWNNALGWVIPIESTDGKEYTSTMTGFNSFPDGLCVTVIPNMTSQPGKEITFNVNNYGDKRIYMRTPDGKFKNAEVSVFLKDTPCRLLYMDDVAGWLVDTPFSTYTSGWWDMEAGVDELATGTLYFQYED